MCDTSQGQVICHETRDHVPPMQPKGAMQKSYSRKKKSCSGSSYCYLLLKNKKNSKNSRIYQFLSLPTPNTPGKTPNTKGLSQALQPHIPTALITRDQLPSRQNCISRISSQRDEDCIYAQPKLDAELLHAMQHPKQNSPTPALGEGPKPTFLEQKVLSFCRQEHPQTS